MNDTNSGVDYFARMDSEHDAQRRYMAARQRQLEIDRSQHDELAAAQRYIDRKITESITQECFEILPDVARAAAEQGIAPNTVRLNETESAQPGTNRLWVMGRGSKVLLNGLKVDADSGIDSKAVGFWSGYMLSENGSLLWCELFPGDLSDMSDAQVTALTPQSEVFQNINNATELQNSIIDFVDTHDLEATILAQ